MRISGRLRDGGGTICPLCKEPLEPDAPEPLSSCAACATRYHAACLKELGGCSTLGCRRAGALPNRRRVEAFVPPSPQPEREEQRRQPAARRPARRLDGWPRVKEIFEGLPLILFVCVPVGGIAGCVIAYFVVPTSGTPVQWLDLQQGALTGAIALPILTILLLLLRTERRP